MLSFMIKVGINGYGTIGRRIAHAVSLQPDMTVIGIVKTKPDYISRIASNTFNIFINDLKNKEDFNNRGIKVKGTLEDLAGDVDIMIDSTPEGVGEKNKQLYDENNIKAIFQGGEKSTVGESSFNAYSNFNESVNKRFVRVVSCNTTGLARTLFPIYNRFGIKHVDATLIRRATDPNDSKKGPINSIEPSLKIPSHHAPDLKTVISGINIDTVAIKVPTTLMHVHVVKAQLKEKASREEVVEEWNKYHRVLRVYGKEGLSSTAQIMDAAREMQSNRSDLYEIALWDESVSLSGDTLSYIQAVHQESDVIPENVDAIRAMFNLEDKEKSIEMTDKSLGIGRRNI